MRRPDRLQYGKPERSFISAHLFVGLLLVLVMLIVGLLFVNSSYFTVGSVKVEGNKYIAVEEVYRIAGIPDPVNIFRLNTTDIRTKLIRDLRITEVEVFRRFPSTIVISLKERQPLAYIASGYGFFELDKQGVVLAAFKNLKHIAVPMITGIRLETGYVGDTVENSLIKDILNYLALLDESTLNQISEINIKSSDQIVIYTVNSIHIRLGNGERLAQKAKLTCDILQELGEKKMAVEYIDLNYATPFVKFKQ